MPIDEHPPFASERQAARDACLPYRLAMHGTWLCGCAGPLILMAVAEFVYNDLGGPCFWPIAALLLGSVGLAVGAGIGKTVIWIRGRRRSRHNPPQQRTG